MIALSFRTSVAAVALAAALAAAGIGNPAMAETTFRVSVDTGPNHVRNMAIRTFLDRLAEATGGELVGELFESGQLYSARDEPKAVARGDIAMSVTTGSSISAIAPNLSLLDMPLFSGRAPEQINGLVDGPLGKELAKGIEDKLGVTVPGRWFLLGFTNTFGAARDMKTFDDFKGARIRVPGGAAFIARYKALGAEGISIPFPDVPLALSQGTIDALLTTHETVRSAKLYEAGVKSVFIDQVSVIYYVPMVNNGFWNGLTDAQRTAFSDTWESVIEDERAEALRRQDSAAEENAKNGIVIHLPDPAAVKAVNEHLLALVPEIAAQLNIDPAVVALARDEIAKLN